MKQNSRNPRKLINKSQNNGVRSTLTLRRVTVMPDRYFCTLEFVNGLVSSTVVNNPGSIIGSRRYRPTSPYDVDPFLLSNNVVGFNELAAFYKYYRVHSSSIKCSFTNLEKFPLIGTIWPSNDDLGNNYTQTEGLLASPYSRTVDLSSQGGMDRGTLSQNLLTETVVGSDTVLYDDNYRSLVTTIPNLNWYWNVGIYSSTGAALVNGAVTLVRIKMKVEFSSRLQLTL